MTARIVTMWTDDHKVHVRLGGDADADLPVRLARTMAGLLRAGATHLVVHLDLLGGDETAVLDVLATTCRQLWLRMGVMETVGLRTSRDLETGNTEPARSSHG
ncbi:MAG TPA: hypothetical protein VGH76_07310 [Actinomycetospora sp.]|uniref:hypothetical protein n=1 Tax=Actinomycetospora sp. TaxID=1872135 RepID=UPI002F3FD2F8